MTTSTSDDNFNRIVLFIELDCFHCQVEEKFHPELQGLPIAVVQNNPWSGGSIISVNYSARDKGVTRQMSRVEALKQCPDLQLISAPNIGENTNISKYHEASEKVANVLQRYTRFLERVSLDEAYLDITVTAYRLHLNIADRKYKLQFTEYDNTYLVGHEFLKDYIVSLGTLFKDAMEEHGDLPTDLRSEVCLIYGAAIASEIRAAVKYETGYECSAGISHNKILAKLACGINKPNKQTILPAPQIKNFFEKLPLKKLKELEGRFGATVSETLGLNFLGDLIKFKESELKSKFGDKNGTFLYNICRGIDLEPVKKSLITSTIGTSKRFPGLNKIKNLYELIHWLHELSNEIRYRLVKDNLEYNRKGKQLVISFMQEIDDAEVLSRLSVPLKSYTLVDIFKQSIDTIRNTDNFISEGTDVLFTYSITFLGISVENFESEMISGQIRQLTPNNKSNLMEVIANNDTIPQTKSSYRELVSKRTDSSNFDTEDQEMKAESPQTSTTYKEFFSRKEDSSNIETKNQELMSKDDTEIPQTRASSMDVISKHIDTPKVDVENQSSETETYQETILDQLFSTKRTQVPEFLFNEPFSKNFKIDSNKRKYVELSEQPLLSSENLSNASSNIFLDSEHQADAHVKCKKCGNLIENNDDSILMHEDFHFAMEIDSEINSRQLTPTTSKAAQDKKRNKTNLNKNSNSKVDIRKFFGTGNDCQHSDLFDQQVIDISDDNEVCSECKAVVKKSDINEHMDFHVAKKMHKELNAIKTSTAGVNTIKNITNNNRIKSTQKPITNFFTKKD